MSEDRGIKVILLGEAGVGKTNLIRVALGKEFEEDTATSLTSSFYDGTIFVDNKNYSYCLWDTAGQELYRSINKIFIKDSKIILIVFAINSKHSFEEIDFWYNYTNEILGEGDHIIALIANKSDLYEQQEISDDEINKKAETMKLKVKLTSAAKDAVGFRDFLGELLKEYIQKFNKKEEVDEKKPETFKIGSDPKDNENNNNDNVNNNGGNKKNGKTKKKFCQVKDSKHILPKFYEL